MITLRRKTLDRIVERYIDEGAMIDETLRRKAIHDLTQDDFMSEGIAIVVVDRVLDVLAEPDNEMVAAGVVELNLCMEKPKSGQGAYRRELARVIWRSMLNRVGQ